MAFMTSIIVTVVVVGFFLMLVVKRLLFVAAPNEALVFSGRFRRGHRGEMGYRIVRGGRSLRWPLIERVEKLDLTMFTIDVHVQNAYSRGGIPLNVVGVANVKVASDEPLLDNAIERFLGRARPDIMRIAKETLEGNLRGVLAQLTPEQVNEDKTRFAQTLIEEAEHDMNRMGLALETLKIQNVSDDVGYLNSIGRIRGAMVKQEAAIAEADASADAAVQKATNTMNAEIARIEADLEIARQQFAKRMADAKTKRTALIAEAEGKVRAEVVQVGAQLEEQRARAPQVERRLEAEVVQPAEADRQAAEQKARGEAQRIIEQGRAEAEALAAVIQQWQASGPVARDVLALQKLMPYVGAISGARNRLAIERMTVLPAGEGSELARKTIATTEQLRAATGIDLAGVARKLGGGSSEPLQGAQPAPPPVPGAPTKK